MTVQTMLAPLNSLCRPSIIMKPKYITIHETDNWNKGAGAINHAIYLQNGGRNYYVSWHIAVDSETATQSIPFNEIAWHAGDGKKGEGNLNSLAIEICVNPESDYDKAVKNTATIVRDLMLTHSIPVNNVVQHSHWTGKNCPRELRANNNLKWDKFVALIGEVKPSKTMYVVQTGAFINKENAVNYAKTLDLMNIETVIREVTK